MSEQSPMPPHEAAHPEKKTPAKQAPKQPAKKQPAKKQQAANKQPAKEQPADKQATKKPAANKQAAKKPATPVLATAAIPVTLTSPSTPETIRAQPELEPTPASSGSASSSSSSPGPSSGPSSSSAASGSSGWRQLLDISRPRATRGQLIVALLCGLLGFALVTQVHSQAGAGLSSARQADLVDVLDNLSAKSDQLRSQIADEQDALAKLTGGAGQNQAALDEAQRRAQTLRILAGTVGATGPGIDLRISDPDKKVTADVLLDSLEELRDAGAEAVEIRGEPAAGSSGSANSTASPGAPLAVRLVASSYFVDALDGSGVVVDGTELAPPYDLLVIGDPPTLSQAMGIPGGVLDTLKGKGASGTVTELDTVRITALHAVTPPKYAHPASTPTAGSRTPGGSS
jgi:uncharacterized protein YlxW (UPF0749 family)